MKRYIPMALMVLLLVSATACAPATPTARAEPPAQQAAPTSEVEVPTKQAAPAEPHHLLLTQTDIQIIDQVLRAIAAGDTESLRALIEFTSAECTLQDGLGGPPKCRAGEAEGTPVEVLPFLAGEGSFLHKDEIDSWTGIAASGLYAVYEVNAAAVTAEQYYPIGRYVILLVNGENQPASALRIGESGIVRIDAVFDASPANLDAMIEREASRVLLPPKS